ncbi:response regulator [Nocardioides dubius]|uniref:Transcriptional regulatory protein n=1 Tax=Nocardioides dubius TaxID=317019 RepID=A0ABN1U2G7_9ACTN
MSAELRVLIVDDDFMVVSIHTRFVDRMEGFTVVGSAGSGAEALARIAELRPDLVLLDVHLPDITGIEVLRRLRGEGDDVGVLMVTAAREAETVRAAAAAGAAHYLVKPFEFDDLRVRMERYAEQARMLADVAPQQDAIDAVFAAGPARGAQALPKGLSGPTLATVQSALQAAPGGELSASECAEAVGISRVSARRYLEHLIERRQVEVHLKYGGAGRPERRYRLR